MTTPPDILAAAKAAYLNPCSIGGTDRDFIQSIAAAIAAERERCAKIAESCAAPSPVPQIDYDEACHDIAEAIRKGT